MTQARVLLLKFEHSNRLDAQLCAVLKSSASLDISLQSEIVELDSTCVNTPDLIQLIKECAPDLTFIILSSHLVERVKALLQAMQDEALGAPAIVVMDKGELDQMVELLRHGAVDYLTPPLRPMDIIPRIWRSISGGRAASRAAPAPRARKKTPELKQLVGRSPAFLNEVDKIRLIATCDANVLISGETGTGKELCARAVHYYSARVGKSFVPINCGAIPTELVENELFGHERGAYTGAATSELGLIHEADGGTLFFDEIDCLPAHAQVKLLRFLQEKEYRPLGSSKIRRADTRIIAATNLDLQEAVKSGRLRRDLFYRLNVISIALPPLRERREDIPLLAAYFIGKFAVEFGKQVADFSARAIEKLTDYDWPGNVRELEHVIERAVALSKQSRIQETDLILPNDLSPKPSVESFREAKTKLIRQFEKHYIQELLYANNGNVSKAARAAHKNRRAFWQLICKHQIDVQRFRTPS